jgi:hypothetical protein
LIALPAVISVALVHELLTVTMSISCVQLNSTANETLRNLLASKSSRGSRSSTVDIVTLLSETARDPSCSVAFNSASLILNTSFFLEKLVGTRWI